MNRKPHTDDQFDPPTDESNLVEAERRRMGGLLEAQIIAPLNLLLSQAGAYEQTLGTNPHAKMAVSVLASLARQALQQTRDLQSNLHPTILEALGPEAALEALAAQETRANGLQVTLHVSRLPERPPPDVELAVFRAVQDMVSRAVQQAHASQIVIHLEQQADTLVLYLADNGVVAEDDSRLRYVRQRIEQLGGSYAFQTSEHGSAELTVSFVTRPPVELTSREMDVLRLLAEGLSNKEIARTLEVSARTVNFHLDNLYSKLGVNSRTEAVVYAIRQGWLRHPR